jgi:hypothetical protein
MKSPSANWLCSARSGCGSGMRPLFGIALAVFVLIELAAGGTLWWPYVLLIGWAGALFGHYRWAIRYGEAHIREEQVRIEWRAGRSKEELVPR